ncbi:hypothetical protein ABZP36_011110 [Zizania latifolia]
MAGAGRDRKRAEALPARGKKQGGGKVVAAVACLVTLPLIVFLMLGGRASASTVWQSAARLTAVTSGIFLSPVVICECEM